MDPLDSQEKAMKALIWVEVSEAAALCAEVDAMLGHGGSKGFLALCRCKVFRETGREKEREHR